MPCGVSSACYISFSTSSVIWERAFSAETLMPLISASYSTIQKYGLEGDFKLNLEANHATLAGHTFEHEMNVARCYDALGWIDCSGTDG